MSQQSAAKFAQAAGWAPNWVCSRGTFPPIFKSISKGKGGRNHSDRACLQKLVPSAIFLTLGGMAEFFKLILECACMCVFGPH